MEEKTKQCRYCKQEMNFYDKKCPHCRRVQEYNFGSFLIVFIPCFLGFLVFCSLLFGDSSSTSSTSNNQEVASSDISTSNTSTQSNIKSYYLPGETYQDKILKISYISLDDNFTGYSKYARVKDGYVIIRAEFEFENLSSTDRYVGSFGFNCYADGYDCDSFYSVEDSSFSANLSSGKKIKGYVYFEVPQNSTEIELEYETNSWTENKVKFKVK